MTNRAAATLAALRATIRSFADQPKPDWDALIAEQDAIEAARYRAMPLGRGWDDLLHNPWDAPATPPAPPAPPTAATAMPARALHHTRRTGWEELR